MYNIIINQRIYMNILNYDNINYIFSFLPTEERNETVPLVSKNLRGAIEEERGGILEKLVQHPYGRFILENSDAMEKAKAQGTTAQLREIAHIAEVGLEVGLYYSNFVHSNQENPFTTSCIKFEQFPKKNYANPESLYEKITETLENINLSSLYLSGLNTNDAKLLRSIPLSTLSSPTIGLIADYYTSIGDLEAIKKIPKKLNLNHFAWIVRTAIAAGHLSIADFLLCSYPQIPYKKSLTGALITALEKEDIHAIRLLLRSANIDPSLRTELTTLLTGLTNITINRNKLSSFRFLLSEFSEYFDLEILLNFKQLIQILISQELIRDPILEEHRVHISAGQDRRPLLSQINQEIRHRFPDYGEDAEPPQAAAPQIEPEPAIVHVEMDRRLLDEVLEAFRRQGALQLDRLQQPEPRRCLDRILGSINDFLSNSNNRILFQLTLLSIWLLVMYNAFSSDRNLPAFIFPDSANDFDSIG